jgi:hypothetical protein
MINANMRLYNYSLLGEANEYGQRPPIGEPIGTIKMAIEISSQSIQDNINYKNASYVGLTLAEVNDTYIIEYENKKLKVLYVNPRGRYKQVFLGEI